MRLTKEQWDETLKEVRESSQILSIKTIHVKDTEDIRLNIQKNKYKENDDM